MTTYYIKTNCTYCSRKATIVGYEKKRPSMLLDEYLKNGGRCPNCNSSEFEIIKSVKQGGSRK